MELMENNLLGEDMGKVISTFNVSGVSEDIYDKDNITDMNQSEFLFTDGFNENVEDNVEEIQMLKDDDVTNNKKEKKKTRNYKKRTGAIENNKEKASNKKDEIPQQNELKSEEAVNNKDKENEENGTSKNFKDYIKLCNSMGLIPSWTGFEKYNKF